MSVYQDGALGDYVQLLHFAVKQCEGVARQVTPPGGGGWEGACNEFVAVCRCLAAAASEV